MQSKPLEASPVVSNTTLAHDRLGGVVRALVQPDFKIGDRVECIETEDACGHYHVGSEGTVENTELDDGTRIMRVYVRWDGQVNEYLLFSWPNELQLIEEIPHA